VISGEEWSRFDAWRREVAVDIRVRAVAMGQPVEYAFLRHAQILWLTMAERFPAIGNAMFDSVERGCYESEHQPDLAAVNAFRAAIGYPALGFLPPLRMREEYRVPMPDNATASKP